MNALDIVIPTFNRGAQLQRCLVALTQQDTDDFRVIIVDDSSDYPIAMSVVPEFRATLDIAAVRTPTNIGPAAARNLGVTHGQAPIVLFLDDDVEASPGLVSRHLAAQAEASRSTVVIGPLVAPADWRPTPWNRWEWETLRKQYRSLERGEYLPTWRQFFTGNASVPREALHRAGGFDEAFKRAEDIELGLRLHQLGLHFVFEPAAIGWHRAYRSAQSWLRNAAAYAEADTAIDAAYPSLEWLDTVQREERALSLPIRALRRAARTQRVADSVAPAALACARVADRVAARSLARGFLSIAYHAVNAAAFAAAERGSQAPMDAEHVASTTSYADRGRP